MNIFVLDTNPCSAARMHCDKHVVKMILESAQMLATRLHFNGSTEYFVEVSKIGANKLPKPLPMRYNSHPCVTWVLESPSNAEWLSRLLYHLCDEYEFRYGKQHAYHRLADEMSTFLFNHHESDPSDFAIACGEISHGIIRASPEVAVSLYRTYYKAEKFQFAKWSGREIPEWFK